ncbi:MAG TPA: thioesterase family protein [Acidimicrobiales bacterium]|nr:thioesterase family protein [Acidimicrobiales bacterium]
MSQEAEAQPDEGTGARAGTAYELDVDTELSPVGGGRYAGELVERWNVGIGPNGGYLAAFCLRGVLHASDLPDPLSMTIHYLSRPAPGRAEVHVTPMRVGRGHATYRFDLLQAPALPGDAGEIRATGLVLMGRLRQPGRLDFAPPAPEVPGPERSSALRRLSAPNEAVSLWSRLDTRIARADDVFFHRTEPGEARTMGWTRLADGRPSDALCVPLFLDSWPPAVFSRTMTADTVGAPTLELTVHWRNHVPPGWLFASFETRVLAGGYVDESGELWSEDGMLVGMSRQLARYAGSGPSLG